ncbi:hypothetical protein [Pulveribacter suum]|uniref:Uncharacterized protein n=1 Tax=Pulveribacter suum TaxID=2116657 RepID=A0A2P1NKK8_9BURK|nr:hypothetical protein [Pulveribacter suum]AVP57594.1 hypothetical protein C7H73_07945 [Pulveribacter suum]
MVRWLLAVFTLHFLLAAGASAFAAVPPAALATGHAGHCSAAQHQGFGDMKAAIAADAPGDFAADTAADCSIDLPDDQQFQRPAPLVQGTHFPCPQLRSPLLASRTPQRQLRPPRA